MNEFEWYEDEMADPLDYKWCFACQKDKLTKAFIGSRCWDCAENLNDEKALSLDKISGAIVFHESIHDAVKRMRRSKR